MRLFSKRKKILVLIIGVIIILSLNFFQKEVKGFFYSFSSPIQKSFWGAGDRVSDFFAGIFSAKDLKEEMEYLRLRNQELLSKIAAFKEAEKENEILREALEVGLAKEFRITLAEVIGKDINEDALLINVGSRDGIAEDMPVITQQKVVLGEISEVYEKFSKVRLISNKESSFDAEIAEGGATGVVKGQGSLKLFLDFIPQEAEVATGTLVISSALGGIYPGGFLVGLTKEIKKSDIGPFQQAAVSPFFDITQLDKVFIILNF